MCKWRLTFGLLKADELDGLRVVDHGGQPGMHVGGGAGVLHGRRRVPLARRRRLHRHRLLLHTQILTYTLIHARRIASPPHPPPPPLSAPARVHTASHTRTYTLGVLHGPQSQRGIQSRNPGKTNRTEEAALEPFCVRRADRDTKCAAVHEAWLRSVRKSWCGRQARAAA